MCVSGWYDIPEDIVFSFPVTLDPKGYWNVVQDITLNDETKAKLKLTYTVNKIIFRKKKSC